jgi:hypothetical protein
MDIVCEKEECLTDDLRLLGIPSRVIELPRVVLRKKCINAPITGFRASQAAVQYS